MSTVRGRIAVDVQFTDSTTTSGVQSLKTLTLQDATEYTSGKVAIVTGTVGTAASTIFQAGFATTYKDASGNAVTFTAGGAVQRLVFSSENRVEFFVSGTDARLVSENNQIAATCTLVSGADFVTAQAILTAGTASYTLVMYGT